MQTQPRSPQLTNTAIQEAWASSPKKRGLLHFLRHFLVMVAAMYVGMLALDPVYSASAGALGYDNPWTQLPLTSSLVMAFNMTLPMALWMRHHHHPWRLIAEMAAAMFVPALAAAGLYVTGYLSSGSVMAVSHIAMIPAMLIAMLLRYPDYAT